MKNIFLTLGNGQKCLNANGIVERRVIQLALDSGWLRPAPLHLWVSEEIEIDGF